MTRRCLLFSLLLLWTVFATAEEEINFSTEVLPILSDRCFHCHGPDPSHRKAKLRLDLEEGAKKKGILTAGSLTDSELWQRIISSDPDELMPPPDSHRKPLSQSERNVIQRWIEQGAPWGKHWAFEKPEKPTVPAGANHPIDAFVRAKLAKEKIDPSPKAEKSTLLRRLSFDLTGLPPTPDEVNADNDWETVIDQKLKSPHHGERMAMWWLDAARYSDTDGYQQDATRNNWPWRDWVVDAFNKNMPFDQFTVEQFAGDLLPDATPEQILATGFHRHHMTNGEGGRHPEESRIDYVIDRVSTTGTVWLGLTLGCAQCHDHKFDPVSQKDFFRLSAYFNSIDETGAAGTKAKPYLSYQPRFVEQSIKDAEAHYKKSQELSGLAKQKAVGEFDTWLAKTRKELSPDFRAWHTMKSKKLVSAEGTRFAVEKDGTVQTSGPTPRQDDYRIHWEPSRDLSRLAGWKLEVMPHVSHTDGKLSRGADGKFILTNVKLLVRKKGSAQVRDIEMRGAIADAELKVKGRKYGNVKDTLDDDPRNGWTTDVEKPESRVAVFQLSEPLELQPDEELTWVLFHRSTGGNANIGRFRISLTDQVGETVTSLKTAPLEELAGGAELNGDLRNRLLNQYLLDDREYQQIRDNAVAAQRDLNDAKHGLKKQNVQVLAEKKEPRETHVLVRGVWDAKGDVVQPAVLPAVLPQPSDQSKTRLDLANWLVSAENPLTSRVIVNHLWQMMFGQGLVRTPEDFGLQGELPTHPELLDYLAIELVENDWNLRHILKLIATSETYQQSSHVTAEMLESDPENRLLARGSRYRLPAWMIRDSALQASGLLQPTLGGVPVKPWQPEGVWREIFMGRYTYQPSVGPARYRRTLYAFWRRSSAPTFLFDSSQRRVCEVGVRRTNTPLQALTLLNDVTSLEASRVLAEKSKDLDEMALRILSRTLQDDERSIMEREHQRAIDFYQSNPDEAVKLLTIGQQVAPAADRAAAIAADMTVASMLLNLDEAITHE